MVALDAVMQGLYQAYFQLVDLSEENVNLIYF